MKLIILGDLHIISPRDEFKEVHKRRAHFAQTWDFLGAIQKRIRQEAPDLVISVGDLIDWYSDENRDEALEFLDKLGAPWLLTPGNHDIAGYRKENGRVVGPLSTPTMEHEARKGWEAAAVPLGNRLVEFGSFQLILMDSAPIRIAQGTQQWLKQVIQLRGDGEKAQRLLFSHVPFNIEPIRQYLTTVCPERDPSTLVQQETPESFDALLLEGLQGIYTGHLHSFPGCIKDDRTGMKMHLLPLSVAATCQYYPRQGTITILELDGSSPRYLLV